MTLRDENELEALLALRDKLADAIQAAEPHQVAPAAAQFRATVGRIAQIRAKAPTGASKADELVVRRAKRRAKPIRNGQTREA